MKRLFFLAVSFLFLQCDSGSVGRGKLVSEARPVSDFHAINSNAVANITLIRNEAASVEVKGYENFLSRLQTSVENGVLMITTEKGSRNLDKAEFNVIVRVPSLDKINVTGVGTVESENDFSFSTVEMKMSGVGSITIKGNASKAYLTNEGAGSIDAGKMTADSVFATTSGVGSINCNAQKYLRARVSGVGSITYSGDPVVEKEVTGIGSVSKD